MILLGLLTIEFAPGIESKRIILVLSMISLFIGILYHQRPIQNSTFKKILFGFPKKEFKYLLQKDIRLLRVKNLLIISMVIFLGIYGLLSASPINWDSNTYNLSRTMLFITQSSLLPEEGGSIRQLIMEIGHDILYWPDLIFFNTRGLGLLCSFEFILLIISCQAIIKSIFVNNEDTKLHNQSLSAKAYAYSITLNVLMLAASPQQVMQALITKNDLIIVVCLMFACSLGVEFIKSILPKDGKPKIVKSDQVNSLLIQLSLAFIAIAQKGYGEIVLVPLLISTVYACIYMAKRQLLFNLKSSLKLSKISIAISLISLSTFFLSEQIIIHFKDKYPVMTENLIRTWSIKHYGFQDKLIAFALNIGRTIFQIILYPFSSLKDGNNENILQTIRIPEIFRSSFGTGGDTSFDVIRHTTHDSAYPSFLNLLLIGFAILITFLYSINALRGKIKMNSLQDSLITPSVLLLGSSIISTVLIFMNIAYQPWLSRFLGVAYMPIYVFSSAVNGAIIALMLTFNWNKINNLISVIFLIFATLSFSTFLISADVVDHQIPVINFKHDSSNISSTSTSSYKWWLKTIKNYSDNDIKDHFYELEYDEFVNRTICHGGESWSLIPILLSSKNKSFSGKNLSTKMRYLCPQNESSEKITDDDITYIYLPR